MSIALLNLYSNFFSLKSRTVKTKKTGSKNNKFNPKKVIGLKNKGIDNDITKQLKSMVI